MARSVLSKEERPFSKKEEPINPTGIHKIKRTNMIVTYIRSSSYNNYDYCQMNIITYVLGHQSTSGKKAQLGTVVHKVMEVLASCNKKLQRTQTEKVCILKMTL